MTDKKQPEALEFCWATELAMTQQPVTLSVTEAREVSAKMQRLHTENTALQAGYAAARLEIESLQARIKTMDEEHSDELAVAHLDGRMRAAQPAGEYPALPDAAGVVVEHLPVGGGWVRHERRQSYTADQMRAYADAACAMRAAQPENLHCKSTQKRLATLWGFVPAGAQQPGAWVPLPGTLPDPGKPVLLDIGKKSPIRAMWAAKHTLEVGMEDDAEFGEYDEATDTYYCPEGWYEWNEQEERHWFVDKTPVAWCELPTKTGTAQGQAPAQAAPAAVAGPRDILEKIDTLIASINEAHISKDAEWKRGCFAVADSVYEQIKDMLAAAPTTQPAPATQQAVAPQGETNVQLDIDSNHSAPGQQRDVARSVALGQPMSKHKELTKSLRASAAAMPFDAAVAVQYLAAADALEAQAREIERLRQDAARYRWLREHSLAAGQGSITVELDDRAKVDGVRMFPIFGPTTQAAPAAVAGPSDAVAYLDIGAGGYLDLGTDLSNEALSRLPKGRHALVIAGTYGIDGYTAAPNTQPAPDEILNMAREQGLPETETEGVFRVNVDDLGRMFAADRAARAPADSVTAPQQEAQEPALFVSAKQLATLTDPDDPDGEHGRYLPVRKTSKGLFTQALYTAPQPSPAAQGDALDAARYRWLRENWSTMGSTYHDDKMQLYVGRPKYTNITPVDIDVAIDAARAAQEDKSHGLKT